MGIRLRRPRPNRPRAALQWIEVDAAETLTHPTAVDDVFARRLDGLTVRGVLTPDEAATAVERLSAAEQHRSPAMFGTMLGWSLAELAWREDPGDRTPYLDQVERSRELYREAFGFHPEDRIAAVLEPMAADLTVEAPREGDRPYNAGNVRWFEPGGGGLPAHAGNEFQMHGDRSMDHLRTTTDTHDHLSWFVVLQAPEEGGALSVYDLLYDTHRPAQPQWTESGRDDHGFDGYEALKVAPQAGGLVVFGGGWRYHRVDPIGGTRPRITYGGFAGRSRDGRALHLWF